MADHTIEEVLMRGHHPQNLGRDCPSLDVLASEAL